MAFCERRERVAELEAAARQLAQELASGQYAARPASEPKSVTTSGGVNLHADTINITGDVTGRDKTTSGATTATPPCAPPRPARPITSPAAKPIWRSSRACSRRGRTSPSPPCTGWAASAKRRWRRSWPSRSPRSFPAACCGGRLGPHPDVITALDVWARHADPRADLTALPTAEARAEAVRPMLARLGKLCVIIDDVWKFDRAALAAVWNENDDSVDDAIRLLGRRSLLNKAGDTDEYRQHTLLRDYALNFPRSRRCLRRAKSGGSGLDLAIQPEQSAELFFDGKLHLRACQEISPHFPRSRRCLRRAKSGGWGLDLAIQQPEQPAELFFDGP